MDNLAHTLIGAAIARSVPMSDARRGEARAVWWSAVLASNIPDIDVLTRLFSGRLETLLMHRGYTHTLIASPVEALISAGVAVLMTRARVTRRVFGSIFLVALVGVLLHIFADSWNEYGVHPFSPFSDRWFYGDFIFIAEPYLWFTFLPFVIGAGWLARALGVGLVAGALGLGLSDGYLSGLVAGGLLVWLAINAGLQWRKKNAAYAWGAVVVVLAVFRVCSWNAHGEVRAWFASVHPGERIVQLSLSPLPANPLCWRVVVASATASDYYARSGAATLAPRIFDPKACLLAKYSGSSSERDLPGARSVWLREERQSISDLRRLANENCRFRALLSFARVPFWHENAGIAGDLRYDRMGGGFATFGLEDGVGDAETCAKARYGARWIPPVGELL